MDPSELRAKILEIQRDPSLSEAEKAKKRQELMCSGFSKSNPNQSTVEIQQEAKEDNMLAMLDETLKCAICFNLCERPVTSPCQHNFCLGCLTKWSAQGKHSCPTCRSAIPKKWTVNPRINSALATAIRMAKRGERKAASRMIVNRLQNEDRPDDAYTTERAVRAGRANAASGRIFVNIPSDHFGPIPPEADPRGQGVLVGEYWRDRLECRQWGAHFPHVAGIAGQANMGAQSVALSGGYEDDEDHGEWFLYTGSGGRDLSGNKRTNKEQSFDQKFESMNQALRISCIEGYPVRVVRSHKEKRSSYAPDQPVVRYDGVYRIEKCWRKAGQQGHLMCRYLFVRCDNEPAPWSSDEHGDRPRPLPKVPELKGVDKVFERKSPPAWDWIEGKDQWGWRRSPPESLRFGGESAPKKKRRLLSEGQRLLKEFNCKLCNGILAAPISTPCGHAFCKECIEKKFEGTADHRDRAIHSGRTMRTQKIAKPCPSCKYDLADFLKTAQVNNEMQSIIAKLIEKAKRSEAEANVCDTEVEDKVGAKDVDSEPPFSLTATTMEKSPFHEKLQDDAKTQNINEKGNGIATPSSPGQVCSSINITGKGKDFERLCSKFPEYDAELLESMLADQGGDVEELEAILGRMKRQAAASERRQTTEGSRKKKKRRRL